jgi:alpha-1,4-digalacturonate transport system substrate-binding protein
LFFCRSPSAAAGAGEIRVACYSDGNECEVTQDLAKRFEAQNADVKVVIDKVPYKAIVEQLPVQLAAGEGPDIARVTELGGLSKYYLDITPYVKDRNTGRRTSARRWPGCGRRPATRASTE